MGVPDDKEPVPPGEEQDDCFAALESQKAQAKADKTKAEEDKALADSEIKLADNAIKRIEALLSKLREQDKAYRCARMKLKARCDCLTEFWCHANTELNKISGDCQEKIACAIREAKNERQKARCEYLGLRCHMEGTGLGALARERNAKERARARAQTVYDELIKLDFSRRLSDLEKVKADIEKAACEENYGRWWYLLREIFGPGLAALHHDPESSPYLHGVIYPNAGADHCQGCNPASGTTEEPEGPDQPDSPKQEPESGDDPQQGKEPREADQIIPPPQPPPPCGDDSDPCGLVWPSDLGFCVGETSCADYGDPTWICWCSCCSTEDEGSPECAVAGACVWEPPPFVPWCDLDPDEYCERVVEAQDALRQAEAVLAEAEAALAEATAALAAAKATHDGQQKDYEKNLLNTLDAVECQS